jgi:succinate--hydroxymethylglutarate CoA-transferase
MSLLSGVRILAVEQYGAGPFGTGYLASLGAEVIKIEQPQERGDVTRHLGPYFDDALPDTAQSLFFQSLNQGKKSMTLNLAQPEGRELLRLLARDADAVISNLRGDVPARLGLTYADLKAVNPKIVCGHLTGYGRTGPRAKWPGYDYLMQAEAGYFDLTGEPDAPPARMGLSMIDYMTGVVMSLGLVSGIVKAHKDGVGCDVDVSLFDVALHNLNYLASWQMNAGAHASRQARSAHPSMVPCQLYTTQDGWIYLMCNKEKFWRVLCEKIERADLAQDPRFLTFKERWTHRAALQDILDQQLATRPTATWMEVFGASVPAAPVHTVAQALDTPFARADQRISDITAGDAVLRTINHPIRVNTAVNTLNVAPVLGAHTDDLLETLGVDAPRRADLRARGVI